MLPKSIRDMRQEARKNLRGMKRIMREMEDYLSSENIESIRIASAFFQILSHHIESGDLKPSDVGLATMLRGDLT